MYLKYGDVYYDAAITVTNFATLTDKEQILECLKASAGDGGSGIFNSTETAITFHFITTYEGETYTFSSSPRRSECPEFVYKLLDSYVEDLAKKN